MDVIAANPDATGRPRDLNSFTRRFAGGERIFEEGSPGRCMYVILAGTVEIRRGDGERTQVLNRLDAGQCFGEMALLEDGVRTAHAYAIADPTTLVEIDKARFIYLVGQQPAFALTVMRGLSRKVASGHR